MPPATAILVVFVTLGHLIKQFSSARSPRVKYLLESSDDLFVHRISPPDHANLQALDEKEEARLDALRDLDLLDTAESASFDRITRFASRLFQAPISVVSLTDRNRQWFRSWVPLRTWWGASW
jgi:hypothetical protein